MSTGSLASFGLTGSLFAGYMDIQYQRCTYGNGATLLFLKVWGLAYERTDAQSRDNQNFEVHELPTFLRYGAPLARLRRAGAPL